MKRVVSFILILTGSFFLFHLLFFPVNGIVDSYFYWAFGEFIHTGRYPFIEPFTYAKPPTVSPPLYSLLLLATQLVPFADIVLHALQTAMLLLTGFLLFLMIKDVTRRHPAIIIAVLFTLLPANLIYVSYVLTEIPSLFLLTLYLYLFWSYLKTKRTWFLSASIGVGFLMGLMKYSFLIYPVLSGVVFLRCLPKKPTYYIFPFIGGLILLSWMVFHYRVTGIFGFTDNRKAHFWNMIVAEGKALPPESHPSMQRLRRYIGANVPLTVFYWDLQEYILTKENREWQKVDEILGDVAMAAIAAHPVTYLLTGMHLFFRNLGPGLPYWSNVGTFTKPNPSLPISCAPLGAVRLCRPVIRTSWNFPVWDAMVAFSDFFYLSVFPWFSYGIFLPALIWSLISGAKKIRMVALLFLTGYFPIQFSEHFDTRYLIPFMPMVVLISTYWVHHFMKKLREMRLPHK